MKKIAVLLTPAEARALSLAAGAVMTYPDTVESTFPHAHSREAAFRGYEKLNRAISEANAWGVKATGGES